jgi:uncharacterized repeat protein (TIGR01451 family)
MKFRIALVSAVLAFATAAHAQTAPNAANGPLETRLEQRKVTLGPGGKEAYGPAEAVKPGELIEYTATYRNTGKQPVKNLEATLPIPSNTEFVIGSAKAGAKASVDGLAFADMPLKRRVVRAGKEIEEAVPARDYRALRWYPGELGAGQALAYTARVKVIDERAREASPQGSGK